MIGIVIAVIIVLVVLHIMGTWMDDRG